MTTLLLLKDRIARETRRKPYADVGLTYQAHINEAIDTAILAYSDERFDFNERRNCTFPTVIDQEFYDADDTVDLDLLIKIDYVNLLVGNTTFDLLPDRPADIEGASTNATATGQPGWYLYYARKFRLYPIPADVWTVRIAGLFQYGAPATDAETGNFWMTRGERLIRSRAKYELALHVLRDTELAQTMSASVTEGLEQMKRWTNKLTQHGGGTVRPMQF